MASHVQNSPHIPADTEPRALPWAQVGETESMQSPETGPERNAVSGAKDDQLEAPGACLPARSQSTWSRAGQPGWLPARFRLNPMNKG